VTAPRLVLGADTLCWHLRLEQGELTLEEAFAEAAEAGAAFVQLSLHHARDRSTDDLPVLARRAGDLGLPRVLASGDPLGGAHRGEAVATATARVEQWIERAAALGSPILRVASGFYRADLAGRPGAIEAERRWTVEVLGGALESARAAGVRLAIENHSDFNVAEYESILGELGTDDVGVFLDLINPISALDDPVTVVRGLAPLAVAGHVKDYELRSIWTEGRYHRRGFSVLWRYPGEGAADLPALLDALAEGLAGRELQLSVEGLDNAAGVADQVDRLRASLALLRELTVLPAGHT
jgi:sugar phosphate isomerase/epimerase